MIQPKNVRVTGFSREFHDIYWEVPPTTQDMQEYEFYVERSEAEAGPWVEIAGPLVDRYYLRDNSTPQMSHHRTLFYRVKMRHPLSGRVEYSPIVDRAGEQDLIAAEINRLETLLFNEFTGTTCWLFPRRTFGQRCPQCWDDVLETRLSDDCPTCFRTGFSGGYHYPIQFRAQFDQPEKSEQVSIHVHTQQKMLGMRCPASPDVKPLDVIIDHQNRRYRVVTVHGTTRLGVRLHQEIRLVLLQPGAIEDEIELKIDASELQAAGWRNFTQPQDPETAGVIPGAALDTLLARFGYEDT